jgi:hypothetical protein
MIFIMKLFSNKYLFPLFALFISSGISFSQEKAEPESRRIETSFPSRDSLPKISLPEFVITGKEKIELPVETKFEILGVRLFIPSQTTDYYIGMRDLSTLELEPPVKQTTNFLKEQDAYAGYLKAGFGRFTTPFAEVGYKRKFDQYTAGIMADYISSKGHISNADFWKGNMKGIFGYDLPEMENIFSKSVINANFGYSGEEYNYYTSPNFKRKINKYFINSSISSFSINKFDYLLSLGYSNFSTKFSKMNKPDSLFDYIHELTLESNSFNSMLMAATEYENYKFTGKIYFDYIHNNLNSEYQKFLEMNAEVVKAFSSKFDIKLNLVYYIFRNQSNYDNSESDQNKFFPQLTLNYIVTPDIRIFAGFKPGVIEETNESILSSLKYITNAVYFRDRINDLDFRLGGEYHPNSISSVRLLVNYFRQENTPVYVNEEYGCFYYTCPDFPGFGYRELFGIAYFNKKSDNIIAEAGYNRYFGDSTIFDIDFRYNYCNLDSRRVPYVPYVTVRASLTHEFPFGLYLEPKFDLVGTRMLNFSQGESERKLKPYFKLDFYADYKIWKNFKVFLNLENIFNQKYYIYEYYEEIPFMVSGGIKLKW